MTILKFGSKGEDVKILQTSLGINADGIFGLATDKAVREFQKEKGLTPDGIVGDHTWSRLGFPRSPRSIEEIIVHCSATKESIEVSSDTINAGHKSRKFSSYVDAKCQTRYIGYHYIIHLDGTIEECRPESKIGCHTSGHNSISIGICYIGGLDANGAIKDTRTPEQKASLIRLIKSIKKKYPAVKRVIGHRDTSPDLNGNGIIDPYEYIKACPCFDAITEYKDLIK